MRRILLTAIASLALCTVANAAPTHPGHIDNWDPTEHPQSIAQWQSKWSNWQSIPEVSVFGTRANLKQAELFYIGYVGYPDGPAALLLHRYFSLAQP